MAKARKVNRASFGNVRQLASGRWQARYPAEDGTPMSAPRTFDTSAEAWEHIAQVSADRSRHVYTDHRLGERTLTDFGQAWLDNGGSRGRLAVKTGELYQDLFNRHITPTIGTLPVGKISPAIVRDWHTKLGKELASKRPQKAGAPKAGAARVRQSYALLKAILNTAVNDGLIGKNPCQIVGAGVARAPERPLMTLTQFDALVEAHPEHLRPLVQLAFGAHLRLGEVVGLQRGDLDLKEGTLRVERQVIETRHEGAKTTPTKTETTRVVDLPAVTVEVMKDYLATVPKALAKAPLFVKPDGSSVTRAQVEQNFVKARKAAELEQFHFHDLRHAGLTLVASSGASIRDIMARAGHSTTAAAMTYQHLATERGKDLADAMSAALAASKKKA
jgi:integrase